MLLLSLTDPNKLKKSKFTDLAKILIKKLALRKLHRHRLLKEYASSQLIK